MAGRPWWVDATVYQIYVRSFADANGDGRGDLEGIIEHLDHFVHLGVDAIWMTPCYPSPQLDHGYDVADYFDIDPTYGNLATFDRLVAACRTRNIRVLMDVVPNHCSDHHQWFQAALQAPPGSPERARFYFRDGKGEHGELAPNNWKAIFGGSAWSRTLDVTPGDPDGTPGQWYLHTFTPWQPDFDWDSPDVVEHFDTMLRFWFDRGVDGFRVDAVTVLGKAPGLPDAPEAPADAKEVGSAKHNPYTVFWPSAHDVWRHWRKLIDAYEVEHPDRQLVAVGEAYTPRRPDLLLDYVRPDEFHQSFCFDLMLCPWDAGLVRETIELVYEPHVAAGAALTWTLNNHDVQRAVTRYGRADATSPDSWTGNNMVYTGTPVDLALGTRRARAMITFVAALPGALYLYQGEEFGLPEVLDMPLERRQDPVIVRTEGRILGRDGCRVPLPWIADPATSFGFSNSSVAVHEPWLPQPDHWGTYALDGQQDDPSSMLSLYRHTLRRRRMLDPSSPLQWAVAQDHRLVAFTRGDVLVVLNPSAVDVELPKALVRGAHVALSSLNVHDDPTFVPANSCVWLVGTDPNG